jgi:hypothetical protein
MRHRNVCILWRILSYAPWNIKKNQKILKISRKSKNKKKIKKIWKNQKI